jgi:hypothetical protein
MRKTKLKPRLSEVRTRSHNQNTATRESLKIIQTRLGLVTCGTCARMLHDRPAINVSLASTWPRTMSSLCAHFIVSSLFFSIFLLIVSIPLFNKQLTYSFNIQMQCFPNLFAHGPLLASKNNHGSSHPCSCKYRMSGW